MKKFIELLRNKEYKNELICDQKIKKKIKLNKSNFPKIIMQNKKIYEN